MALCRQAGQDPLTCGSSKRQQPYRPQVSAITRHRPSDLPRWPVLTFLPLVHTEAITLQVAGPAAHHRPWCSTFTDCRLRDPSGTSLSVHAQRRTVRRP
jgi:hypothetical protein